MSNSLCSSNVTAVFIDMATFDETERYLYGGKKATSYFVSDVVKSTWFTQVPVILTRCSGQCNWGQEWAVNISRSGDYLLDTWLAVEIGDAVASISVDGAGVCMKWTPNLMHNLISECCITFNDLVAARFDNYHLDFWAAFTVPAEKSGAYNAMIGNAGPVQLPAGHGSTLYGGRFYLPLPFFFSRDSGLALPTAALPYNDMKINFSFRDWSQLITVFENLPTPGLANDSGSTTCREATAADFEGNKYPNMRQCQVWGNYAIVSNDERQKMACAPRDILIEQVQTAPIASFAENGVESNTYDLRFAHSVKALFWGVRNESCSSFWSNYTTRSPIVSLSPIDWRSY